jgi:uncharacterized protein
MIRRIAAAALATGLALVFAALPVRAQDEDKPGFDCAKARTAAEKSICATPSLGQLDGMMGRYYRALLARLERQKAPAQMDQLRRDQAAWLQRRDGPCLAASNGGRNADRLAQCLERAYRDRLVELAALDDLANKAEDKPAPGWSGDYRRVVQNRTDGGNLLLLQWPDGTWSAAIETVSGPTHHTCDVAMTGMKAEGGRLAWSANNGGEMCTVTVAVAGKEARVTAANCTHYCGARGHFDGAYRRP